jgi:hypothetical protein
MRRRAPVDLLESLVAALCQGRLALGLVESGGDSRTVPLAAVNVAGGGDPHAPVAAQVRGKNAGRALHDP